MLAPCLVRHPDLAVAFRNTGEYNTTPPPRTLTANAGWQRGALARCALESLRDGTIVAAAGLAGTWGTTAHSRSMAVRRAAVGRGRAHLAACCLASELARRAARRSTRGELPCAHVRDARRGARRRCALIAMRTRESRGLATPLRISRLLAAMSPLPDSVSSVFIARRTHRTQ